MTVGRKTIDLDKQTILTALPIPITQIYAFHKIKKTKQGAIILGLLWLLPTYLITYFTFYNSTFYSEPELSWLVVRTTDALIVFFGSLVYPPLTTVFVIFYILIPIYFVRRWSRAYNNKTSSQPAS